MTIQTAAQNAINVQDGVNSRGIARAMVEAMDAIANDPASMGTRYINQHPIVYMYLYKLSALNGNERIDEHEQYNIAEAECKRIAALPVEVTSSLP